MACRWNRQLVESQSSLRVDRANNVVHGVKVLGLKSVHGYNYPPSLLRNPKTLALYEGKVVNVDHPNKRTSDASATRSYRDRFGMLTRPRFVEGQGIFADLIFNPKHAVAEQFAWDAENNPRSVGLSQYAAGRVSQTGLVESIERVASVDIVADPATTQGLYEGMNPMIVKKKKANASKQRRLREAAGGDEPAAPAQPQTPLQALADMARAVILDESIDVKAKQAKLNSIVKMLADDEEDPEAAGGEGEGEADDVTEDATPKESKSMLALKAKLAAAERTNEINSLCESVGLSPTDSQRALLDKLPDEDARVALIESWGYEFEGRESATPAKKTVAKKPVAKAPVKKELKEATDEELKDLLR